MMTLATSRPESTILDILRSGGAYTVAEIAQQAVLPVQTAAEGLSRLRQEGQVASASQYHYRFFRLASLPEGKECQRTASAVPRDIRFARSCYGHLAGWLGVAVTNALLNRGYIAAADSVFELTAEGRAWLAGKGIALSQGRVPARRFARPCLDWTEKRPHLAGVLGEALLAHYVSRGWLERWPAERTLKLTTAGETALEVELGIPLH